jgi:hypothetical protein
MRKFKHTVATIAPPETIWQLWTNVDRWVEWDTELLSASMMGEFRLGAVGQLTPRRGVASSFQITQFQIDQSYTLMIALPLCQLQIQRYLSTTPDGPLYFTHDVSFRGFLAWVFALLLGRRFRRILPQVMENLKQIAEQS